MSKSWFEKLRSASFKTMVNTHLRSAPAKNFHDKNVNAKHVLNTFA